MQHYPVYSYAGTTGKVKVKVVPSCSTEEKEIFPPIFSTNMRVRNSPSPVPMTPSVPGVDARKNF